MGIEVNVLNIAGEVIGQQHRLLAGEIPEIRADRYLCGRGDLLDRRRGVTLLVEQPERLPPDRLAGAQLLALPPAQWAVGIRFGIGHDSILP